MERNEELKCLKNFADIVYRENIQDNVNRGFSRYGKIYAFTNENSKTMIPPAQGNRSALMILSSGDQVFDALLKGYDHIDTIDINEFCRYYSLGLKKTAIEVLTYQEFCDLFDYNKVDILDLLEKVINNLDEPFKEFWMIYLYYTKYNQTYSASPLNIDYLFFGAFTTYKQGQLNTTYLSNEDEYNKLKKILPKANITFRRLDISENNTFDKEYELISFSNVLGYLETQDALEILEKVYNANLIENGAMLITGIWHMFTDNFNLPNIECDDSNTPLGYMKIIKENSIKLQRKRKDDE